MEHIDQIEKEVKKVRKDLKKHWNEEEIKKWKKPYSKGDAAFYAISELLGYLEDLHQDGILPCINGQHVLPVKEIYWCLHLSLVSKLSGDEDYFAEHSPKHDWDRIITNT